MMRRLLLLPAMAVGLDMGQGVNPSDYPAFLPLNDGCETSRMHVNITQHKTVLVIGASRGIGREVAVLANMAKDTEVHATVRSAVAPGTLPPNVKQHELEVLSAEQIARLARDFRCKPIDVIVHSAGISNGSWPLQREVNAYASFRVIEALMPSLLRSRTPRVCILTSTAGRIMRIAQLVKHSRSKGVHVRRTIAALSPNRRPC